MAGKTNLSATLFSQKKLLGKTSTGTHRADSNEPIPSGLQVSTSAVFAEDVPSSPNLTLNTVQDGTVEYVEFVLQAVTGSTYDANDFDSGASAQSSGPHAYRLTLPANYETNSNNTKRGDYPFVNGQILHWTLGALQIVSPGFSNDVPNPYTLKLFKSDDTEIPLLDEIDWQVDYFSGILFVQDYDASKIPATAKGFIYTGKMLSQSLGEALVGGGGGGSGTGVGWFGSGNGSISTSGSVYFGTQNTSNPEIFFSSVGAATFNEQGRNVDFRVETTGDQNTLFVQGSTDRVGIGLNAPATSLHVKDSNPTIRIQRDANTENGTLDFAGGSGHVGASIEHEANSNDLVFNVFNGSAVEESLRMVGYQNEENRQVILLSGSSMHAGAMQPKEANDIAFFVSGAIGSRGTSTKGASVFGGDVIASGSLTSQLGLSGSLTKLADGSSYLIAGDNVSILSASNGSITISAAGGGGGGVSFLGGVGLNNQMITSDGSGNIVAETNITFNGSQLSVTGSILPGSDNTFDLGSPSFRFANIYTGDLHLQNDRGHWQVIEEADDLTVVNRLTNIRYKIVMEPYEDQGKK